MALAVQRARSAQSRQSFSNIALPARVIFLILVPAGHVTVAVVWSTVKSSTVNPPGTAGRSGAGLTRSP